MGWAHAARAPDVACAPSPLVQVKTHGLEPSEMQRTRERVLAIWPVFVGGPRARISRNAFAQPDGLADAIISACEHERR